MAASSPIIIGTANGAPVILCSRGTCKTPSLCFEQGERCGQKAEKVSEHGKR